MKFWSQVAWEAYTGFQEDDSWALASHIALNTLTSIFPFLIFVTAIAGFFGSQQLADEAAALLFDSWPQRVAQPIATEIHNVLTQPRGGLLTLSAVLALYFSSSSIEALRIGLNRAYDIRDARPWWLLRLESIGFVFVGALSLLLLAFLVIFSPLVVASLTNFFPAVAATWDALSISRFVVSATALALVLFIAHTWLPDGRRNFFQVVPGIVLTLVFSLGFALAFGFYLSQYASNYVSTYAGLASVMIALVFLYTLACIFLAGGEVNAAIMRVRGRATKQPRRRDEPAAAVSGK